MVWEPHSSALTRGSRWVASAFMGRMVGQLALDVTATSARRSCLVVAPHPDDETLGCGATIARKAQAGARVNILVLSDGATWPPDREPAENAKARHRELLGAVQALGLPPDVVTHRDLPEMGLSACAEAIGDAVADAVRAMRPEEVYCTSPADPHPDHSVVGGVVRNALAGSSTALFEYAIWQWHRPATWLTMLKESGRPQSVNTATFVETKRKALVEYPSQISLVRAGAPAHTIRPPLLRHFLTRREVFFPYPSG